MRIRPNRFYFRKNNSSLVTAFILCTTFSIYKTTPEQYTVRVSTGFDGKKHPEIMTKLC